MDDVRAAASCDWPADAVVSSEYPWHSLGGLREVVPSVKQMGTLPQFSEEPKNMTSNILIVIGVIASALAQLFLKKGAQAGLSSIAGIGWGGASGISYVVAFGIYAILLRTIPISRLSPLMTISVMLIVVVVGLLLGETLTLRLVLGVIFGICSIYLLLS